MIKKIVAIVSVLLMILTGCKSADSSKGSSINKVNRLTKEEKQDGWKLLFDGETLNDWRGLGRDYVQTELWTLVNGEIKKLDTGEVPSRPDGQPIEGGDLMTIESFWDYELYFEWKVLKAGNSGVKYNVSEEISQKYSKYSALGFEYQLLDDLDSQYVGKLKVSQFTGSLYDMIAPKDPILKPVGTYNSSSILVHGNHVEHWLNGKKVVEYDFGSERMDSLYQKSKYHKYPNFMDKKKSHIILQNHKDEAWFRNIKIRKIK
jgi:hypothetical protein